MGETSTYLFSLNDKAGFVQEALAKLGAAGVISPEDHGGEYAAGPAAWATNAFEYLGTHQSPLPFIIPQDPAVEPSCPACGTDVNEAFYDLVNEIEDDGQEVDWSKVKVTCPRCQTAALITALKDRVGVFCSREYIYFTDVEVDDLKAFETQLRMILPNAEIKSYWYT
jgi:endogenous inhibitor of DNA gyrase (YacG/DUF329 family)